MFKPIGIALRGKNRKLNNSNKKSEVIRIAFNDFLDRSFKEYKDLFSWEASFKEKEGRIYINTGSKVVANELSLKIKELSLSLKKAGLVFNQIVIS